MPASARCPKCDEPLPSFGFTWEDVDQLRRLATWQDVSDDGWKVDLDAASLADRIAALLPPRET